MKLGQAAAAGIATLVASCASTPPALPDYDDVRFDTYARRGDRIPNSAMVSDPTQRQDDADGAVCVLRNDRGRWTVTTPGIARVGRSSQPLEFECTKTGFVASRGVAPCFTESQFQQIDSAFAALSLFAAVPAAIAAAPVAPALAAEAAVQAAGAGTSLSASPRSAAKTQDRCIYSRISVPMTADSAALSPPRP